MTRLKSRVLPLIIIFSVVLTMVASFVLVPSLTASAATKGEVIDNAHLFTSSEKSSLQSDLSSAASKLGIDHFVVYTTDDNISQNGGRTFTEQYYASNYSNEPGVILVVSVCPGNRLFFTIVNGSLKSFYTSANGEALDDILEADFKKGDYYEGITKWLDKTEQVLSGTLNYGSSNNIGSKLARYLPLAIFMGIAGFVVFFIIIFLKYRKGTKVVEKKADADTYMNNRSSSMTKLRDNYLYTTTVVHKKSKNNGGGGGGRSSHFSSGSSAGGGRSF